MADTKERKLEAAHTGEPPPDIDEVKPSRRGWRRTLWIVIGVLVGFVVYAYAFETTEGGRDPDRVAAAWASGQPLTVC